LRSIIEDMVYDKLETLVQTDGFDTLSIDERILWEVFNRSVNTARRPFVLG